MASKDCKGTVIALGTIVMLTGDAIYYGGKDIPDWVKKDQWVVTSVSGDRVVLGKNVSGANEIKSPVNSRYLVVTGSVEPKVQTKKEGMNISEKGVELIARYEGCRLQAYKCPAGVWTIGYGHTAGVQSGHTLSSEAEAKKLLKEDLKKYGDYVNACVRKGQIRFPLTQNMFDALTSFCYNCGNGSLRKLVEGREAETVADKLLSYNKGGGRELLGLTRRRKEERELFLRQ